LWLAKLYEHQRQLWAAAKLFCEVSGKSDMQHEALEGAKRCFIQVLDDEADKEVKLAEAVRLLQQHYVDAQGRYLPHQRHAAMIAAHLRLRFARDMTVAELQSITSLMQSFLDDEPGAGNLQWRDRAQSLLIAVLARRENWSRAEHELRGLQHALKETWFDLLALITTHHPTAIGGKQQELGRLQLAVLERISMTAQELTAEEQLQFARWQADALMRTGGFSQAQVVLKPLVEQHPHDGQLQETYAQSLLQADSPAVLQRALAQWRIVLRRSPPQSSRWYRAKYAIALAYFKLGQSQRTAEMIKLLAALHPDLGGDETRTQFLDLLAKCKR
jgi:predicted Zn-dependent protease